MKTSLFSSVLVYIFEFMRHTMPSGNGYDHPDRLTRSFTNVPIAWLDHSRSSRSPDSIIHDRPDRLTRSFTVVPIAWLDHSRSFTVVPIAWLDHSRSSRSPNSIIHSHPDRLTRSLTIVPIVCDHSGSVSKQSPRSLEHCLQRSGRSYGNMQA